MRPKLFFAYRCSGPDESVYFLPKVNDTHVEQDSGEHCKQDEGKHVGSKQRCLSIELAARTVEADNFRPTA
jgi:hypothetical protein